MKILKSIYSTLFLFCLLIITAQSHATLIKADFTSTVHSSGILWWAGHHPVYSTTLGSSKSGMFTFDSEVLSGQGPMCADKNLCWSGYPHTASINTLQIDSNTQDFMVLITISDSNPGAGPDIFEVKYSYRTTVSGFVPVRWTATLTLTDNTAMAFESPQSPLMPDIALFDDTLLTFRATGCGGSGMMCRAIYNSTSWQGTVNSLIYSRFNSIPEPGSSFVFFVGILSLFTIRRLLLQTAISDDH